MKVIGTTILHGHYFDFRFATLKDKKLLVEGFKRLSSLSKLYRFHRPYKILTEKDANYFMDVDNYNHLAIGVVEKIDDKEYGIGLIRYIREQNNPDNAEVGLTIIDSYQNQGLGTELYAKLLFFAKKNGIKTLTNHVFNKNVIMIELLKKFNCVTKKQWDGTIKIIVTI
jgi:RimJ/RimL family protein N-acetyltransferase